MDTQEFFEAIRLIEKEKKVPADLLCEKIRQAIITAIKNEKGRDIGVCEIDPATETLTIAMRKEVVEEVLDPAVEILVDAAKRYNPQAVAGDFVEIPLQKQDFSRIAATNTKNVVRQCIREAERSQLKQDYQNKHQELVTVKVINIDEETGNAMVELGRGISTLPKEEQVPGEVIKVGDLIKVYVKEIHDNDKTGVKAMISRTHSGLVRRLFEEEVPEIFDGTVEIKAISREAGSRTKIAVYSADENVDAVGSCIGARGARVGKVVDLLGGEKIDIVKYSDKPEEFIGAALAPADVISVEILEGARNSCSVTVPDDQLSLAIGNKGQNARLAARLTGWKIDIKPESGFFEIKE
ncbi:MAG TPA: transcription termination/antitermination protein NusA [Ruminococcaceae bacterium]|nr:transcription termination/antitermination protein NusA [Oscillospiraceae bacterium]